MSWSGKKKERVWVRARVARERSLERESERARERERDNRQTERQRSIERDNVTRLGNCK